MMLGVKFFSRGNLIENLNGINIAKVLPLQFPLSQQALPSDVFFFFLKFRSPF